MTETAPLDNSESLFWRGLCRLVLKLPRYMGEDLERATGITETEISVIAKLYDAPDRQMSMSQLVERTSLSPSRISRVIDLMERRGLVTKEPDLNDRRKLYATLTVTGRRTYERAEPELLLSIRRTLLDHMSSEEVDALGEILCQILESIDPGGPLMAPSPEL